jgi:excisionase family DNA binding protein
MEATPTVTKQAPQCLGREEFARRLGVSLRTADALILSKQIKSLKVGKKRLVTEDALAEFIRKREAAAAR